MSSASGCSFNSQALGPLPLSSRAEQSRKDCYSLRNNASHIDLEGFIPFKDTEVYIYINIEYIKIKRQNNKKLKQFIYITLLSDP